MDSFLQRWTLSTRGSPCKKKIIQKLTISKNFTVQYKENWNAVVVYINNY